MWNGAATTEVKRGRRGDGRGSGREKERREGGKEGEEGGREEKEGGREGGGGWREGRRATENRGAWKDGGE